MLPTAEFMPILQSIPTTKGMRYRQYLCDPGYLPSIRGIVPSPSWRRLVRDSFNEPVYIYVNTNARDDDKRTVDDAIPVRPGWYSINKRTVIVLGSVTLVAFIASIVAVEMALVEKSPRKPPVSEN